MSERQARASIAVTGTELLTGRVRDRNGPWLAERLGELGFEVASVLLVGDRPDDLDAALRFLGETDTDLIVTSGGLGPTADDLTAEVVARYAGREMVLDETMEQKIAKILAGFARRLRFDPEALRDANRKQAMVPRGAATVDPAGTAPGLVVPVESGPTVIVLPGPPRELQEMWPQALATEPGQAVVARAEPFEESSIRMFGLPESEIAQTLRRIEQDTDLTSLEITTCLRRAELVVDIRGRPGSSPVRHKLVDAMVDEHGAFVFSVDGSSIDEQVAALLLEDHRVGLAESCTAGLLAARLSEPTGASAYLAGGVVAYSNDAKRDLLDVPEELIAEHGAVSPEVAEAMADGALARFRADLGVGITGIAGPEGGTEPKPVGYVCVCVKSADGAKLARDPVLPGDRSDIRDRSATVAMHLIRRLLRGEDFPIP